jgi:hypothetical protein
VARLLCIALLVCSGIRAHESTLPHALLAQTSPLTAPASLGPVAPLTIELRIDGAGEPVAGLVRITSVATGKHLDLPAHLRRPMGLFSLTAGATVDVPASQVRIEACHGLETEIATTALSITAGERSRVTLKPRRFYDPAARQLVAANTHLHLRLNSAAGMGGAALRTRQEAEDYLVALGKSDALDLVYVSHLVRASEDRSYISNEFTREDFTRLSGARLRFVNGEEHRHEGGKSPRRGGPDELRYGHVLFLDLPQLVAPVSYGAIFTPATAAGGDALPMRTAIREARAQNASIIWCHGKQGTEDVPNWIDGLLHAQNIFDGGSEGSFETVFYPYLNAGFRVPFSTGTDWGCYDFSRVYVPLRGAPSSRAFLDHLAAGRSFITNGAFLEFEIEGHSAGDTVNIPQVRAVKLRGRGLGRDDFGRIEVVFNGTVVAHAEARPRDGYFVAELDAPLEIREPGWLALRLPMERPYTDRAQYTGSGANLFGKALFAHTSPVYVNVAGQSVRQPAALRALIAEAESAIRTIEAKGAFPDAAARDALLAIYRNAIATLAARL